MLCKKCEKKLKPVEEGFSFESFFKIPMSFCENNECSEYGTVTVVGIKEKVSKEENNK